MRKIPMRSCVICREKTDKRQLLRIVRNMEGRVVFDPTGKLNGRGAYVCTKDECIEELLKLKKINSALEANATGQDMEEVIKNIKNFINNRKGEGKG